MGFLALLCGFLVAIALTHYVQRYLSTPIVELATTLDRVSASGDYSMRAESRTGDEVGRLVNSFNTMLGVIQKKDVERNELLLKSQESNRIKDEFLATVSHELRTPLNAMLGWLQIIRTTNMDPATVERAMASIERNAQSQARVVEDLIELSRVVTGKLQSTHQAGGPSRRSRSGARRGSHRGCCERRDAQSQLPSVAGGHVRRQGSAAAGHLESAVECGEVHRVRRHGERRVGLATIGTAPSSSRTRASAFPPNFCRTSFERFRQADQSTTREHGGLGLGWRSPKRLPSCTAAC